MSADSAAKGTIHLVANTDKADASTISQKLEPAASKPSDAIAAASAKEDKSTIAEGLKDLVGTWMAVARHGDGELTTVELQLDSRGWAKLTVPGADGTPSTTTHRVEFENREIKLTGTDADLNLGKLVEFNSRQMVLDRADGQVTFVRP